jgi:hypothetical protein
VVLALGAPLDGAFFGGYVKPANWTENRRDRHLLENQTGKRQVVVIMRDRNGIALPFVFRSEAQSIATIASRVDGDYLRRRSPELGYFA